MLTLDMQARGETERQRDEADRETLRRRWQTTLRARDLARRFYMSDTRFAQAMERDGAELRQEMEGGA